MNDAELLDSLTEIIKRQAEIIRKQRIMLMLHGIQDDFSEADFDGSIACLDCPNAPVALRDTGSAASNLRNCGGLVAPPP